MGKYLKTHVPGIFKFVDSRGRVAYGISYRSGGKKHREIVGPLLGEARAKLEEVHALAKSGGFISAAAQRKFTFAQLAKKYEENQSAAYLQNSKRYFVKALVDHFGDMGLSHITPLEIENFKKKRKETPTLSGRVRSDIAVNRELETLRHMLNRAVLWKMLTKSPFGEFSKAGVRIFYVERNDRCRYLKEEEIQRLLATCPVYLRKIVQGALLTGLRKGDLLGLRWSDVDLERRIVYFNERKKGGKRGEKVLSGDLVELLRGIGRNGSDYVFTGPQGEPLKDVKRAFKTALKKAGIEDFHFHDLRHTSASYLAMRSHNMKVVQEHLGHSSLAMTERYAHLADEYLRAEVEKLDGLFTVGQSGKILVRRDEIDNLLKNTNLPTA
jgi:integrase